MREFEFDGLSASIKTADLAFSPNADYLLVVSKYNWCGLYDVGRPKAVQRVSLGQTGSVVSCDWSQEGIVITGHPAPNTKVPGPHCPRSSPGQKGLIT